MNDEIPQFTALVLSTEHMYLPGHKIAPPSKALRTGSLTAVVTAAAASFAERGAGVLGLDSRACAHLGLPVTEDDLPGEDEDEDTTDEHDAHPAIAELRRAGWRLSRLRPWTVLHAPGRPTVNLCLIDIVDGADCHILTRSYLDTVSAMDAWHRLTGTSWFGKSGMAGLALMRNVVRLQGDREPTWKSKMGTARELPEVGAAEYEYVDKRTWRGPSPKVKLPYLLGFDINKAYLSAAGIVHLAPYSLKHTGPEVAFSSKVAGWWLVELAEWTDPRLPHPAGYAPGHSLTRWVTGPTLALLDELKRKERYEGYTILDSWTCEGAKPILKQWSKVLAEAIADPMAKPAPGADNAALRESLKRSYAQGWGMLNSPKARVSRPDWHFGILALSRANGWRKADEVGRVLDRWPAWIETDNFFYPCRTDDYAAECPTVTREDGKLGGFVFDPTGVKLGGAKPGGVKRLGGKRKGTSK